MTVRATSGANGHENGRDGSRLAQLDRRVKTGAMDLTYPPEAEEFRTEIRAWLEENLPDGWFDEGFEMTPEQK